jgi:hypothetical protein
MEFMFETLWFFVHAAIRRSIPAFHSIFATGLGLVAKEGAEMPEQINAT